ncbi:MAG: HNH endonuclease, partial [Verrucomicrobia bacterium]|nr:HNH endonuclease [Verrucomicrobiota bacterium]
RIYQNQDEIRAHLKKNVPRVCPRPFQYHASEQAVTAKFGFNFTRDLSEFPAFILPHYEKLIRAIHPVLLPIIDSFTEPLSREERKCVIKGRKRIHPTNANRDSIAKVREYSRSIPRTWKIRILEKARHECVLCRTDLRNTEVHFDHVIPVSKGGLTLEKNLQALCAACNLKKGNRVPAPI